MPTPFLTARDPILSLFQSAAAAVGRFRTGDAASGHAHPLPQAVAGLVAARRAGDPAYSPPWGTMGPASTCAGLGLELLDALVAGDPARRQAVEDRLRYSACDPLWASTLVDYLGNLGPGGQPRPVPYIRYAELGDFVVTAPAAALRVGLLSDWATGTDEARAVAALLARQRPDVVIHLGDIYYAGTQAECDAHFLAPLRAVLPDARLFTLCGNHDVYSGGRGYYDLLGRIGQPASYLCLRSPDLSWQILGADTGLHDADPFDEAAALTRLEPAEELWHIDKLRGFPGRTLLLSHHQPFSAFAQIGRLRNADPVNPNLMESHARLATAGPIEAWFWGHEHSLRLYAPYRGVLAGRNIGHGAIPVQATPGPAMPIAGLIDPPGLAADPALDVVDGAYTHGFALLDLHPGGIEASYWALTRADGPIHRETFAAGPMV